MKKTSLLTFMILASLLFVSCTIKPSLTPINIHQVDIGKDGKMFFEIIDTHQKVVVKNRTNLPGIHHDVDENNYQPEPYVEFLKKNIIENLLKSPGLEILMSKDGAEFLIQFNLQHFDVYRETSGGAAAVSILLGGLLGAALMEETCTAEIKGVVTVTDMNSDSIICSFNTNVSEKVEFRMNDVKKGYTNATQQASTELVKQIIAGLTNC